MKRYFTIFVMVLAAWSMVAQDQPLFENEAFAIFPRKVVDGNNHAQVQADNALTSTFEHREWLQHKVIPDFPTFSCGVPLSNALYNLSLEELNNLIEKDSTWRTGKLWEGVWTRDVSYSALLAAAYMNPLVTRTSLMKRVNCWRVLQDTGTGGSWPVSSDRVVWVLAAWEYYLVTGDRDWLKRSYDIVRSTLMQDELALYDQKTGLVRGESTFLDWREESYPRWMEPADIAMSECLGTNALFFRANQIAARMASLLGDRTYASTFEKRAGVIKDAINQYLWLEDKGYYGQYLYGREYLIVSPRSETLGEALCILYGIADKAKARRIVSSVRLTPYGTPCFDPQIPNVYPYHNNAVWPFVQAFWMWAAAEVGNQQAVLHSMASIYRPAAIYTSNHENFVATDGGLSTAINSPSMLWSVAGNISVANRVLMGLHFEEQGLAIRPFVPREWSEPKRMNLRYRKAQLEIVVEGFGDKVQYCLIDGKKQKESLVPASLTGKHKVRVVLADSFENPSTANFGPVSTSLETVPQLYLDEKEVLAWHQVLGAKEYKIIRNGQLYKTVPEKLASNNRLSIPKSDFYTEYQVIAVDENGNEGFASEPLVCYDKGNEKWFDMTRFASATNFSECKGYSGNGSVEVANGVNNRIDMTIDVRHTGDYRIDFRYANGSGNLTSSNQCASRTLWMDVFGQQLPLGSIVMPQRGKGVWDQWGMSNGIVVHLIAGQHKLVLTLGPENDNMSAQGVNRAVIDAMRLVRIK